MRLFFYYAAHSFVNQIRKLLKTWVLIFIVACMVLGGIVGIILGTVADKVMPEDGQEETVEETEPPEEGEPIWEPTEEEKRGILELATLAILVLMLSMHILWADKSGSAIFLPADVNLLFASPMRPQSVVLFRLLTQMGMILFVTAYLLFDLHALIRALSLSPFAAVALVVTWISILAIAKVLQTMIYVFCSSHPKTKKYIRPVTLGILVVIAGAFYAYMKSSEQAPLDAAFAFFNVPWLRYLPIVGWTKGILLFAIEGNLPASLLSLLGTVGTVALLLFLPYRIRPDFYEDALAKSEETAAALAAAQEGRLAKRGKKDRSERLRRDGFRRGAGANVFFFKTLYNRFRFATFGFLTKTTLVYLAIGVILPLLLPGGGMMLVIAAFAVVAFFRTLGNPVKADAESAWFATIPASTFAKLFWSLLGGTVCCALDLLPGLILATALTRSNPLVLLAGLLFVVSLDFYSSAVGAFIDFSTSVSAGKSVKQMVQIFFLYFGLVPDLALFGLGLAFGYLPLFMVLATVVNLAVGAFFYVLSPILLEGGRK